MRKQLTILFLLLGLLSARAEVLLVEDFDDRIGNELTQCGMWYVEYSGSNIVVISNGLEMEGYVQSGIGNGALINTEGSNGMPHLAFTKVTEGCVYVAMMIQGLSPVGKGGWIFSLRDKNVWNDTYNENCRLLINADNQLGVSVAKQTGVAGYDTLKMDSQKVYLAVLKYEIKPGANNDETSLYVLDTICAQEPKKANVGPLTDSSVADIEPANIVLRGFDDAAWIFVDGIRVATTWEEALGIEPTALKQVHDAQCTMHNGRKVVRNGHLVIEQDGCLFSILGTPIQ